MQELRPHDARYARLVDRYSRYIQSPVLRLKFLNNTLSAKPRRDLMAKFPLVGTLPERMQVIVELSKLLPPNQQAPLPVRATALAYRLRYFVYGATLLVAISLGTGLVYTAAKLMTGLSVSTEAKGTLPTAGAEGSPDARAVAALGADGGLNLDKVWLAEEGADYEFYSNGARVLTQYQTPGEPRRFFRFSLESLLNGSSNAELQDKPVGIVYHLSESDLLPFETRHNSSLQVHSKGLVQYAREHALYNYVIDRFGRTYRIVRDEDAASHAGNSFWSDDRFAYVNLSSSFIGICFEGRSASGTGADGINEAQIYAARILTAVLRSKFDISDTNCVTHGLVSVNPSNKLMGYHTDWVYGFPFEALGLTNKNKTELLAVSRFGFGYDQAYLATSAGKKWEGLTKADAALREASERNGITPEAERKIGWTRFQALSARDRTLDTVKSVD